MAREYRNASQDGFIPALMFLALLLTPPAWGEEAVTGAKDTAAKPAASAEKDGRIDEEIAAAKANITTDPANASFHVRLGHLFIRKGALDDAMRSFDEALKYNPRSNEAKTGRGIVLARKGNLAEAAEALKDALVLNPNPVRTHYELGLVYERLGELDKAVAELKEAIRKHEQGR